MFYFRRISGTGKAKAKLEKYHGVSQTHQYPAAADSTLPSMSKRKRSESEGQVKQEIEEMEIEVKEKKKKVKKEKVEELDDSEIKTEGELF